MSKSKKIYWKRGLIALTLTIVGIILILLGIINGKIIVTISGFVMILFGYFIGLRNEVFKIMLNRLPPSPGA